MNRIQVGETKTLTVYGVRGRDRVRMSTGEFGAEAEHPLLTVTPTAVPDEFALVGVDPRCDDDPDGVAERGRDADGLGGDRSAGYPAPGRPSVRSRGHRRIETQRPRRIIYGVFSLVQGDVTG